MVLKLLAVLLAVGLSVLAPAASAQEEAPPPPLTVDQAVAMMTTLGDQFSGMMRDMGWDLPEVELHLTSEQVTASIPQSTEDDVGDVRISADFDFRDIGSGEPVENPQDYVVFATVDECRPVNGEVVYFRTIAVDDVVGHQCVVTVEDGQGVWGLRARSVAARGELRVRSGYAMAVVMEGRPERARELGESVADGAVALSTTLADHAAAAAAVGRYHATEDPAESIRRFSRLLERMATTVDALKAPASTESAPRPRS